MRPETLMKRLAELKVGESLALSHSQIDDLLPPGIEDDKVKRELKEVALEASCDIRAEAANDRVVFTKKGARSN